MDDRTIRNNVLSKLTVFDHRATAVAVAVESGVVSLYGEVATASDRLALEATCLRIPGVRAIVEHLQVRPVLPPLDDRSVALDAIGALEACSELQGCRIGLIVADGVVTLRGEVDDEQQRTAAEQCLRDGPGVADVHNLLVLRSEAEALDPAGWVRETIARKDLRIRDFAVELGPQQEVRLVGQTDSWFDRDAAERAAWSAPGVRAVDNRIALLAAAVDPEAEWSGMPES